MKSFLALVWTLLCMVPGQAQENMRCQGPVSRHPVDRTWSAGSGTRAVVFSEDFSGGTPQGWTWLNQDGLIPEAAVSNVTDAWVVGPGDPADTSNLVAISTSWYTPPGTADDWMITPPIALPEHSILTWRACALDAAWPDGYEVRLSASGTNPADFNTLLFEVGMEQSSWTERQLLLNAYAGQTVYLAFRNHSTNQYLLLIDNIQISVPEGPDAKLASVSVSPLGSRVPLSQADFRFSGVVANPWSEAIQGARLILSSTGWADTLFLADIPAGDSLVFSATDTFSIAPTGLGYYNVRFALETDSDPDATNNLMELDFEVTSGLYARDRGTPTPTAGGIGFDGHSGQLGTWFEIQNETELIGVSAYFDEDPTAVGKTLRFSVCRMSLDGIIDTVPLVTTDILDKTTSMSSAWASFTITPTTLDPGLYTLFIHQLDSFIALGNDFEPVGELIYRNSDTSSFLRTKAFGNPRLRMVTQGGSNHYVTPSGLVPIPKGSWSIYPNPANQILNIVNAEGMHVRIVDARGACIQDRECHDQLEMLNISSLAPGLYIFQVKGPAGVSQSKFSIVR